MFKKTGGNDESAIGTNVMLLAPRPNTSIRYYLIDRPAHTKTLRATEAVLDISIALAHPVRMVWPIFKDFNLWMNRFGFVWDGLPAENENGFVYLENRTGSD